MDLAKKTNASYCLTSENFQSFLPNNCKAIITDKVLLHTAQITKIFYPDSVTDEYDNTVKDIYETELKNKVKFGKNVLIGENVKIGTNCLIGHNSIIEKNVNIGDNCSIGSNVIIRNSFIKNNVHILDGCIIGKKGFGFFPGKSKNIRYPHVGSVLIGDNVEIGCNNTIDRGSLSNTIIGDGTSVPLILFCLMFSDFISDFISLTVATFAPDNFDTLTLISFSVYSNSVRLNSSK